MELSTPFSSSMKVDKEKGIIHDVRILNRASVNKRDYSPRALRDVAALAEGARVFDQHSRTPTPARKTKDQLAIIRRPRVVEDGVIGDLQVSAREKWLLEDAERMPDAVMLSIDALGRLTRQPGAERGVVESVHKLDSIDLVPKGGTTNSLFESEEEDEVDLSKTTLAELRKERPDLLEEHASNVLKSAEANSDSERKIAEMETAAKENKETIATQKKKLDEVAVTEALAAKKEKVADALKEADLPEAAVTDEFVTLLEGLEDEAIPKAIEDRQKLVESVGSKPITGGPRNTGGGKDTKGTTGKLGTVDEFVESLQD